MSDKPIVITMGDPSGVGAEVTVKAIASMPAGDREGYAVIGDHDTLQRAVAASDLSLKLSDTAGNGALRVIHVPVDGLPGRFWGLVRSLWRGVVPVHQPRGADDDQRRGRGNCHRAHQ